MKKNKMFNVYLSASIYSIIVGLSFLFNKVGLRYSQPLDLLAYRFTFALVAIIILILFGIIKTNISFETIKHILPLSLFYPLLSFGFQIFGQKLIQSSEAGILFAIGPILTMILASTILKEKTNKAQKMSILVSVFGVLYITFKKGNSLDIQNIKGIVLTLISVFSFSMYNVLGRKLRNKVSSGDIIIVIIVLGFISFNLLALGNHALQKDLIEFFWPLKHFNFIVSVMYLGVLSTLLTSYLIIYSLSHLESYKMGVFANLSTIVSIFAGAIILKEEVFYYHLVGSMLIIVGVVGANLLGRNKKV